MRYNPLQPVSGGDEQSLLKEEAQEQHTAPSQKTCILITGPTATGKTALSIQLALDLNTQIISADSRQCFRELNIGVAKPSLMQLQKINHYFINSHSIHDVVNAALFESYALAAVYDIFRNQDLALMVGGTGLYIKAFCEGIDEMPVVPEIIREEISLGYTEGGLAWLQQQLQIHDPAWFSEGEIQNPRRLMRALEIVKSTGRSILSFQNHQRKQRDFQVIKIGLQLGNAELHRNIDQRVNEMIGQGLVEEVQALLPFRQSNALQTVGYKELFDYFDGNITLEEAIDAIKLNTRHYAKRQMTWFRKDQGISWFHPDDILGINEYVSKSFQGEGPDA